MKILFILLFLVGCTSNTYYAFFPDNHGSAKVVIDLKNKTLEWSMELRNLDMITQSHIHCLPSRQVGVSFSTINFNLDIRVKGTVLTPDKGNMCGWLTWEDVKKSIEEGNAIVMVHTYGKPGGATEAKLGTNTILEKSKEIIVPKGY